MQKANERRKNEEKYAWRKIQICANRSNGGEELISAEHLEKDRRRRRRRRSKRKKRRRKRKRRRKKKKRRRKK